MHSTHRWRKLTEQLTGLALAAVLSAGVLACAEEADDELMEGDVADVGTVGGEVVGGDFYTADVNRDTRLTTDEFGTWWRDRGIYDRWNVNADRGVDEMEAGRGIFGAWDRNEAGITEAEWNEGAGTWFGDANFGTYDDWDLNNNNLIEENEFTQGFERAGVYDTWDANRNQYLEDDELFGGLFGVFDDNEDRYLDENEWNTGYRTWDWGV